MCDLMLCIVGGFRIVVSIVVVCLLLDYIACLSLLVCYYDHSYDACVIDIDMMVIMMTTILSWRSW